MGFTVSSSLSGEACESRLFFALEFNDSGNPMLHCNPPLGDIRISAAADSMVILNRNPYLEDMPTSVAADSMVILNRNPFLEDIPISVAPVSISGLHCSPAHLRAPKVHHPDLQVHFEYGRSYQSAPLLVR